MMRKLKYRSRVYDELPTQEPRFQVGDVVHEIGTGVIGVVEYLRRDGQACIRWPSGTRNWLPQSSLCGPLEH
jgi:hypothetical protein